MIYYEAHGHFGPPGARLNRQATREKKCTCNCFARVLSRKNSENSRQPWHSKWILFVISPWKFLSKTHDIVERDTVSSKFFFDTTRLSNRRPIPPLSFSPLTAPANSKMRGSGVTLHPGSCSEIDYRLTHAVSSSMYISCLCRC